LENRSELPPEITGFASLATRYDGVLCDIWGVIHNGVQCFPSAVTALQAYRRQGGVVTLITNSPRLAGGVADQLAGLGAPDDCWDGIVTSGDITRALLMQRAGQSAYHLGPERDRATLSGTGVALTDLGGADFIICTGLFEDDWEGPEDYRDRLVAMQDRGMQVICSNPDLMVQRGTRHVYCAGALAALYEELGGAVIYTGKPWPSIYESALSLLDESAGRKLDKQRILAIGDGIKTDLAGASRTGIDCLFVLGGIHAAEAEIDSGTVLADTLAQAGVSPVARQVQLIW